MSFAKPPTYRVRKAKKPVGANVPSRSPFGFKGSVGKPNTGQVTGSAIKPGATWTLPASMGGSTGATPPPGPPNPNAPTENAPIVPPAPPPETLEGGLARSGARDLYNIGIPDINHQLWEAAFNYGGAPQVQQAGYALNPATGKYEDTSSMMDVGSNPNSKLSQIARQLGLDTSGLSNDLNTRGSFFSGAHLEGQGRLDDQAGRDRLQAQQDYQDAILHLVGVLGQARHDRDVSLGGADITDLNAAVGQAPENLDNVDENGNPVIPPGQAVAPRPTLLGTETQPSTVGGKPQGAKTKRARRGSTFRPYLAPRSKAFGGRMGT